MQKPGELIQPESRETTAMRNVFYNVDALYGGGQRPDMKTLWENPEGSLPQVGEAMKLLGDVVEWKFFEHPTASGFVGVEGDGLDKWTGSAVKKTGGGIAYFSVFGGVEGKRYLITYHEAGPKNMGFFQIVTKDVAVTWTRPPELETK